jgi:hypothetical protein
MSCRRPRQPVKASSKGFEVVIGGVVWSRERLSGLAAGSASGRSSPRKRGPGLRTIRETPQAETLHLVPKGKHPIETIQHQLQACFAWFC